MKYFRHVRFYNMILLYELLNDTKTSELCTFFKMSEGQIQQILSKTVFSGFALSKKSQYLQEK